MVRRNVEVVKESSSQYDSNSKPPPPIGTSKNVAGPAVYYPPGHTPFAKKEVAGYQASVSICIYLVLTEDSQCFNYFIASYNLG